MGWHWSVGRLDLLSRSGISSRPGLHHGTFPPKTTSVRSPRKNKFKASIYRTARENGFDIVLPSWAILLFWFAFLNELLKHSEQPQRWNRKVEGSTAMTILWNIPKTSRCRLYTCSHMVYSKSDGKQEEKKENRADLNSCYSAVNQRWVAVVVRKEDVLGLHAARNKRQVPWVFLATSAMGVSWVS